MTKKAKWITQQALATELGVKLPRVCNWVSRGNIKSKKKSVYGIEVTLVDRNSIEFKEGKLQ